MANVTETPSYDAGIYQIETTDPVLGGPNGIANAQAKGLANRTAFLKQQIDQLNSGQLTPSWIASQSYVQEQLQKLDAKQSVRAATTANITLSGVQTIDGVALTVGDRVLVKDQTAAAQNGIYLVAAQSWYRSIDADSGEKLTCGARVPVEEGSVNSGKAWFLSNKGTISVGTTNLVFLDENPYSSETTSGQIKISSQSQTDSGNDDASAVTPKKLRFGFSFNIGENGYLALPSWLGGFIFQWCDVSATSGWIQSTAAGAQTPVWQGQVSATLPISFIEKNIITIPITTTSSQALTWGAANAFVHTLTKTGFSMSVMSMFNPSGSISFRMLSIGK